MRVSPDESGLQDYPSRVAVPAGDHKLTGVTQPGALQPMQEAEPFVFRSRHPFPRLGTARVGAITVRRVSPSVWSPWAGAPGFRGRKPPTVRSGTLTQCGRRSELCAHNFSRSRRELTRVVESPTAVESRHRPPRPASPGSARSSAA